MKMSSTIHINNTKRKSQDQFEERQYCNNMLWKDFHTYLIVQTYLPT